MGIGWVRVFCCCALVVSSSLLAPGAPALAQGAAGTMRAVAGGPGHGPALNVAIAPRGLFARGGSLLIADENRNVIRSLDLATGTITNVAGNGSYNDGDGHPPNEGPVLAGPSGVAADGAGNLFVADTDGYRVARVDVSGTVTTFAAGVTAQRVDIDADDNLYVSSRAGDRVMRYAPGGAGSVFAGNGGYALTTSGFDDDGKAATEVSLGEIADVEATPDGSVYIASRNRVWQVKGDGTIHTVAGGGPYSEAVAADGAPARGSWIGNPSGVAVDALGRVIFSAGHVVRRVEPGGTLSTIAGTGRSGYSGDGGPATAAQLWSPADVEVGPTGVLYISDESNQRVRRVDAVGVITTVAGNGSGGGSVGGSRHWRDVDETNWGGDGADPLAAQFFRPAGIAVAPDGHLIVADSGNFRLRKVSPAGVVTTIAGNGTDPFGQPRVEDGPAPASSTPISPIDVAVDAASNIYFTEHYTGRVRKLTPSGTLTTVAGGGWNDPNNGGLATEAEILHASGIDVDALGNVYFVDDDQVRKVDLLGIISTVAGNGDDSYMHSGDGGPATAAGLHNPSDVALDGKGNLYIATSWWIRRVGTDGKISTVAGNGDFDWHDEGDPALGAAVDPYRLDVGPGGEIFYSDDSMRVSMVKDGYLYTVAGMQGTGRGEAGIPATTSPLDTPRGIAVDSSGDLFVVDSANQRVMAVEQPAASDNDRDDDDVVDSNDNCPYATNPSQRDTDGDGNGDACDWDPDGDGIGGDSDNCPLDHNSSQTDYDGDGKGDACDYANDDRDADGVSDGDDNCPSVGNSGQQDADRDGVGDACEGGQDAVAERAVSVRLRKHLIARGTVTSTASRCRSGPVLIQRRTRSGWRTTASATADVDGLYRTRLRDRRGLYRAVAPPQSGGPDGSATCPRRVSTAKRHRHR